MCFLLLIYELIYDLLSAIRLAMVSRTIQTVVCAVLLVDGMVTETQWAALISKVQKLLPEQFNKIIGMDSTVVIVNWSAIQTFGVRMPEYIKTIVDRRNVLQVIELE